MVYLSNLQIFSLMLSQLSYPRNVVMNDVILGLIVFLPYVEVLLRYVEFMHIECLFTNDYILLRYGEFMNYTQDLSIIHNLDIRLQYNQS